MAPSHPFTFQWNIIPKSNIKYSRALLYNLWSNIQAETVVQAVKSCCHDNSRSVSRRELVH